MDKKTILKKYQDEGASIIVKMATVLMRAQRKVDDKKYRETMETLKEI